MSASREKNKRKAASVNSAAATPAEKTGMNSGLKNVLIGIAVVVFVAAVVLFTMLNNGFFARHTTAATVGEHKVSPAMMNFFYSDVYNTFNEQYSSYVSLLIDTDKPLSEQDCTMPDAEEGITWADYFMNLATEKAKKTYTMYDNATAEGYKLSEEDSQQIQSYIDNYGLYASLQGMSSADSYIAALFGKGCNAKLFREYLTLTEVANDYTTDFANSLSFTQEDIDAEYQANAADYDTVTYRSFYLSYTDYLKDGEEEATDEEKAQTLADAKEMAEKCSTEEKFVELCREYASESVKEYYDDDDYSMRLQYSKINVESVAADWLFDTARENGDVETFESETGVYVLFFLERGHNEDKLVNVRHILFKVDDTSDTVAMENAKQQAEEVLAEYAAGEQTEDAFAELAKEHSADSTADRGGLIENVYPGQMVKAFDAWCFNPDRHTGDVEIVETEYGYHIIYFVGQSDKTYQQYTIENKLKNDAFDAWEAKQLEGVEIIFKPEMMKYTTSK